jgi:alpha 1,2-mannosyltransferase
VTVITQAPVFFGHIPADVWNQPDSIDEERAKAGRAKLHDQGIIYAGTSLELH